METKPVRSESHMKKPSKTTPKRSPFHLQYKQFEQRLQKPRPRTKLPSLGQSTNSRSKPLDSEQYLALARHLKQNQRPICFSTDKENVFEEEERWEIERVKGHFRGMQNRNLTTQQSQNQKSRVSSQTVSRDTTSLANHPLQPLCERDPNSGPRFLDYKRGRREVSFWG